MKSPNDAAPDDAALVRYLIGSMSEAETERIDELSIADDDVAARLMAVENDLVDAYVNGRLPGETRDRFEARYLSSPGGRAKIEFARAFHAYPRERSAPATVATSRPRQWLPYPALAAASVLLAAGSGYLLFENSRLRNQFAETRAARGTLEERQRDLERRLATSESANSDTSRELARVRETLAELERRAAGAASQSSPLIATVLLRPATRGLEAPPTLPAPSSPGVIVLNLATEGDEFSRYEAALQIAADQRVVWRSGQLRSATVNGVRVVSVTVPAEQLRRPQVYIVELTGVSATGSREPLSTYPLRVVGQRP